MPRRDNFNPQGKLKIQVQIHNLVNDLDTANQFLNALSQDDIKKIATELQANTVSLIADNSVVFDPKPYDESAENSIDTKSQEEKDRQLHVGENDNIKSYQEYSDMLNSIIKGDDLFLNASRKKLFDVLTFVDNCYGGTNADFDEDMDVSKYYQMNIIGNKQGPDIEANQMKNGQASNLEADLMRTHVCYIDYQCKTLSNALSKYKSLENGYIAPQKIKNNQSDSEQVNVAPNNNILDESSFIDEAKDNYVTAARRFTKPQSVMEELKALDDVYHQMYAISNRLTDSSEFKKMLGNLKEIHEVYNYYKNNTVFLGQQYTGDNLAELIEETAQNTTKYIDKLGADSKYRSSDKGNTKLLGAVQVLSTINPRYTEQHYSNLKLKMPDGTKAKIAKNSVDEMDIRGKNDKRPVKITFDKLVKTAGKKAAESERVADNKARREYSRMKKRATQISADTANKSNSKDYSM